MSGPNLPRATKPHRRVANCPPPSHQTPPPSRQCPPPRHQTPPPSRQIPPLRRQRPRHHSRTRTCALPGLYIPPSDLLRAAKTIYSPDPIPLAAGCLSSVLLTNHTWRTAVLRPDLPHWPQCNHVLFMALAPLDPYAEADLSVTTLPPLCRRKRG